MPIGWLDLSPSPSLVLLSSLLFSSPELLLHQHPTSTTTAEKEKTISIYISMGDNKRENKVGGGPFELSSSSAAADGAGMRTAETLLRLLPMSLCVVALILMLKNSQTNDFGSLSYSNLGAFRYLVHANGICAGYSLLSAIVAAVPRPSTLSRAWTFFFLDQLLTYTILGAGAVSTEVVYLAYKGDAAITWSETCGSFGGFCRKATASISISFVVVLCYAALSLISSYRLFSKYDAPDVLRTKGGIEIAAFHG